jgi:hypothetical protein
MSNTTYNGWTNYATWRVNLEMFDGTDQYWSPEAAREFVEEWITSTSEGIAQDYAMAFLSDVNWHEISEHTLEFLESDDDSADLEDFFVDLIEEGQTEPIIFECKAEDKEHAKEQAENSYPNCTIVGVV